MTATANRYDRNIGLFGEEGQARLLATRVAIAGVGGLGSAIAQHLALLGVGGISLIEPQELDDTNRNRFIGARAKDPVPGSLKVDLVERMINEINPTIPVEKIPYQLVSPEAFAAIKRSHWVIGGFDHDGPRHILNELCSAYAKPYIDLASDVLAGGAYGGQVCVAQNGNGCLSCLGLLDRTAVRNYLLTGRDRAAEKAIYGVDRTLLKGTGPSVSPLNGVVASLGATEFMVAVTQMRAARRILQFRGHESKVTVSTDQPAADCYYCKGTWGQQAAAGVERYLDLDIFK
jgi:molybdopterin/thiamine biosynthesis adenylyltransferase